MNKLMIFLLINLIHDLIFIETYIFISNTDRYSETDFEYDCIEYEISRDKLLYRVEYVRVSQNIRYCIRPSYRSEDDHKSVVEKRELHHSWKKFTFKELYLKLRNEDDNFLMSRGFTSIDIIERFKIYLETLDESMSEEEIYQCNGTWFGSECEYILNPHGGIHSILDSTEVVNLDISNYIRSSKITVLEMTCYTHLICNRGLPPACLDWREICDGKNDCANNDGIDEHFCELLDTFKCNKNEYRCRNGRQCIPKEFYHDDPLNPDCQDNSDEIINNSYAPFTYPNECDRDPTFRCEERTCPPNELACGDGQCVESIDQCYNYRGQLLIMEYAIYGHHKNLLECRSLPYLCQTHIQTIDICKTSCWGKNIVLCEPRLGQLCLSTVFKHSPATFQPSSDVNIFFNYDTVSRKISWIIVPHDNCLNDTYCNNTDIYSDNPYSYWCLDQQQRMPLSYIGSYSRSNLTDTIHRLNELCYQNSMNHTNLDNDISLLNIDRRENKIHFVYDERMAEIVRATSDYSTKSSKYKWKQQFPYFKLCDRKQNINSTMIDGTNHTDETECDHWPINNIYTRCNNHTNCSEINAESTYLINRCHYDEFLCPSILFYKIECLSKDRILDGRIDCIGGIDEYLDCDVQLYSTTRPFGCISESLTCIDPKFVCDGIDHCETGQDEYICHYIERNLLLSMLHCESSMIDFCLNNSLKGVKFLSLMNLESYPSEKSQSIVKQSKNNIKRQLSNVIPSSGNKNKIKLTEENLDFYCHRGLGAYVALSDEKNRFEQKCFCPPSYYGNRCQYQSDRVSLTLKMQFSFNYRNVFIFLIILTDEKRSKIDSFVIHKHYPFEDCNTKFHFYLLYSSPMKNQTNNYFIHIDMFQQEDLSYYSSWKLPINHNYLPVTRISVILKIPGEYSSPVKSNYCPFKCRNGQCMKYVNVEEYFCQCKPNWYGLLCNQIQRDVCSSHSISMGSSNNRQICLCKSDKFGPRCYFDNPCVGIVCKNGGICRSVFDLKYGREPNQYRCICTDEFEGRFCEQHKPIVSFQFVDIQKSLFMIIHIISNLTSKSHVQSSIFKKLDTNNNNTEDIFISEIGINLIFVQLDTIYYLVVIQERTQNPINISTVVSPKRQCHHISDLLNSTMAKLHPLRRLKSYPRLCSQRQDLVCFHDERLMCICNRDYFASCIDFAYDNNCSFREENPCEREGRAFQDRPSCPSTVQCICSECYYGNRCQFSTIGLGISLDAILGYEIQPTKSLFKQSLTIKISAIITIIMFIFGFLSSLMSLITFRKGQSHEVGCGQYLFALSIASFLVITMFVLKFVFLLLTQMSIIIDKTFLFVNCLLIDISTKSCLDVSSWLSACIAVERTVNVIRGIRFNKRKSKQIAIWIIIVIIICVILSHLPDPLYRVLLYDKDEQRTWCIERYPPSIATFNSINISFHCIIPSSINAISAIIIIIMKTRIRFAVINKEESYFQLFFKQLRQLKHLLIAPSVIVLLFVPRLILAFISGCMKSNEDLWIYLIGYFISFIPPILIFLNFVLPSRLYKNEFNNQIKHLLKMITRVFCYHD